MLSGGVLISKKRRQIDRFFKVESVRLVTEERRSVVAVAQDLGIGENLLHRWKQLFTDQQEQAFVGIGKLTPEQAELRRLRRDLIDVTEERDILKKAISVFSD